MKRHLLATFNFRKFSFPKPTDTVYPVSVKGTCWILFALLATFSNIENTQYESFRENVRPLAVSENAHYS